MVEVQRGAIVASLKTSIGACIMALLEGGLVTLGILCIFLLSPEERHSSRQHKILRGYIVTLLLVNLVWLAVYFPWSHFPFIYSIEPTISLTVVTTLSYLHSLLPAVVLGLTDGLLVWRCYRVQKILGGGSNVSPRGNAFWIIPFCLWVVTLVTALVGSSLIYTQDTAAAALQTTALISNAAANSFATLFIVVRLQLHKRNTIALLGHQAPALQHLNIVNIILQSAAINVPITIVVAVGIGSKHIYGIVVAPIAITCQSFSSVLIIYQVALRRAIDDQKEGNERSPLGGEFTSGVVITEDNPTVPTSSIR